MLRHSTSSLFHRPSRFFEVVLTGLDTREGERVRQHSQNPEADQLPTDIPGQLLNRQRNAPPWVVPRRTGRTMKRQGLNNPPGNYLSS